MAAVIPPGDRAGRDLRPGADLTDLVSRMLADRDRRCPREGLLTRISSVAAREHGVLFREHRSVDGENDLAAGVARCQQAMTRRCLFKWQRLTDPG